MRPDRMLAIIQAPTPYTCACIQTQTVKPFLCDPNLTHLWVVDFPKGSKYQCNRYLGHIYIDMVAT